MWLETHSHPKARQEISNEVKHDNKSCDVCILEALFVWRVIVCGHGKVWVCGLGSRVGNGGVNIHII
jgi:hypothetical protein